MSRGGQMRALREWANRARAAQTAVDALGATPAPPRRRRSSRPVIPPEPEGQFMARITLYADLRRWEWHHEHDSRYGSKGWPDLELVRGERHIRAEVKRAGEEPDDDQAHILAILRHTRTEVYVFHPHDCGQAGHHAWPDIEKILR